MADLKTLWGQLKSSIDSCGSAGVHGDKVAELKDLAEQVDEQLKNEGVVEEEKE